MFDRDRQKTLGSDRSKQEPSYQSSDDDDDKDRGDVQGPWGIAAGVLAGDLDGEGRGILSVVVVDGQRGCVGAWLAALVCDIGVGRCGTVSEVPDETGVVLGTCCAEKDDPG